MTAALRQRILDAPGAGAPDHPILIAPAGGSAGQRVPAGQQAPAEQPAPAARLTRADVARLAPGDGVPEGAGVAICIADPLALIRVLVALDGHAGGLLLLSASLDPGTVATLAETAGCQIVVSDREDLPDAIGPDAAVTTAESPTAGGRLDGAQDPPGPAGAWMMTTSGTTGVPKIVPHTLDTLARTVRRTAMDRAPVWGLVLEPTRFAGLQVVLQALLGGGTLVAPPHGSLAEELAWMAEAGVTHLSATPTLWRRILMAPGAAALPLRQVTMGGEIADDGVLGAARARFPDARITHIYASTEAGVGFAVGDGRAGFPISYTTTCGGAATCGGATASGGAATSEGAVSGEEAPSGNAATAGDGPTAGGAGAPAAGAPAAGAPTAGAAAGGPTAGGPTAGGGVGVKIVDGQLWLRPPGGHVPRYLGGKAIETDADGYVATGDRVEVTGDRVAFLGRDSGAVNVGGVKVWPERVERTIAAVPGVGLAQVTAKTSPITGALLMATVVPDDPQSDRDALQAAIMAACRAGLEREAVPARIRFADSLQTNAAGKILRS